MDYINFPIEMFKDDYYRVVRSSEEYKVLVDDGWSAKKPVDHPYLPVSAKGIMSGGPPEYPVAPAPAPKPHVDSTPQPVAGVPLAPPAPQAPLPPPIKPKLNLPNLPDKR